MLNAKAVFNRNIDSATELSVIFDHLSATVAIPAQFDDLLRSQIVNAVSAFDKLMHDLIRIGMVMSFENIRPATPKYLGEAVSIAQLPKLIAGAVPPPSVSFEEMVRTKLSFLSFQDAPKISEGLSYIWDFEHKWQRIALGLGMAEKAVKLKQKLIVTRRNAIVHEADLDPVTHLKRPITREEAMDTSRFIQALGNRICDLVI